MGKMFKRKEKRLPKILTKAEAEAGAAGIYYIKGEIMNKTKAINKLRKELEEVESGEPYKLWTAIKPLENRPIEFKSVEVVGESAGMYCILDLNQPENKRGTSKYTYRKTKEEALIAFSKSNFEAAVERMKHAIGAQKRAVKYGKEAGEMIEKMKEENND